MALFCELVVQISLFFTKISITIFLVENMARKCVANRTDIYRRMDRHGGSSNETIHHTKIDVNIAHSVRLSVCLTVCSVLVQQCNQHLLPPATTTIFTYIFQNVMEFAFSKPSLICLFEKNKQKTQLFLLKPQKTHSKRCTKSLKYWSCYTLNKK